MNKILIIYHANCFDGTAAAWAVKQLHRDADTLPAQYGDDPPDVSGYDDVFIVDFSYPKEVLERIAASLSVSSSEATRLIVLDHHKTAAEGLIGLDYARFETKKSGAVMAWEYCFGSCERMPLIFSYIQDCSLHRNSMYKTLEVNAAIQSRDYSIETFDKLANLSIDILYNEGAGILRYKRQTASAAAKCNDPRHDHP